MKPVSRHRNSRAWPRRFCLLKPVVVIRALRASTTYGAADVIILPRVVFCIELVVVAACARQGSLTQRSPAEMTSPQQGEAVMLPTVPSPLAVKLNPGFAAMINLPVWGADGPNQKTAPTKSRKITSNYIHSVRHLLPIVLIAAALLPSSSSMACAKHLNSHQNSSDINADAMKL